MWQAQIQAIEAGDIKTLARCISLVENETEGSIDLLQQLPLRKKVPVIGITGAPGAGKSTLTDGLVAELVADAKKVAILCIDPSSPFHLGALLGDRIRMSQWYTHPNVFIRSLASRGSLGGLSPQIIAITELLQISHFDYIIVETVGVGQSEIEIAGLADISIVVVVPEAGDEVQTMKAGLMEIADIFVVNKADRPGADQFVKQLRQMLAPVYKDAQKEIPILKTIASQQEGVSELFEAIEMLLSEQVTPKRRSWLLAEKAWQLLVGLRMSDISKKELQTKIETQLHSDSFNLYRFVQEQR